jgi:hypothetical protein
MMPIKFNAYKGFSDEVLLSKIYTETERHLAVFARAAGEGRAYDEANNFLRWLQYSGLLTLLEKYCCVSKDFLKLRKRCDDLQEICRPMLQNRNCVLPPSIARIDEANQKLDVLLSYIAKQASPPIQHTPDAGQPALTVIAGVVSS